MSNDTSNSATTDRGSRSGEANMRASDSDRETVAAVLQRHHLEGRLDLEELSQRLDRCHTAKTVGELHWLRADLPRVDPARAENGDQAWRGRSPRRLAALLPVFVMLAGISLVAGAHVFWLAIPLTFFAFRAFGWSGGWLVGAGRRRALPSVSLADHPRHSSGTWSR